MPRRTVYAARVLLSVGRIGATRAIAPSDSATKKGRRTRASRRRHFFSSSLAFAHSFFFARSLCESAPIACAADIPVRCPFFPKNILFVFWRFFRGSLSFWFWFFYAVFSFFFFRPFAAAPSFFWGSVLSAVPSSPAVSLAIATRRRQARHCTGLSPFFAFVGGLPPRARQLHRSLPRRQTPCWRRRAPARITTPEHARQEAPREKEKRPRQTDTPPPLPPVHARITDDNRSASDTPSAREHERKEKE